MSVLLLLEAPVKSEDISNMSHTWPRYFQILVHMMVARE